jgi:YVTN family beta-propeller protein
MSPRLLSPRSLRLAVVALFLLPPAAYWLTRGAAVRTASAQTTTTFHNFESPQVHPLALTPDGTRLLAVNTPNATLSVFQLVSGSPVLTAEIPVGLEPVSVAARNDREAWVANWLSDSVSIVDLSTGNVTRTIDVGDEPTDVLFAGLNNERAFVCVAGGGHLPISGNSITGASGAVKVFDPSNLSAAPQVVEVFGKQPRALARNADGSRVFVSVFESGSQTTVVPQSVVAQNGGLPAPQPAMADGLPPAPNTALIVKWNGSAWADENGDTKWDRLVNYTLADIDLVTIDAAAPQPTAVAQVRHLGTQIGNMAFDPTTSRLYVLNRDDDNVRRFEPNLRGRFQTNRVSALDASQPGAPSVAFVRDLNPHVDLSNPAGTDAERAQSLALLTDIKRAADGTLYVAATSSAKVGVLDADGNVAARIDVGQGPTGLALDEARAKLYVLNRFDETLSVVDTANRSQETVVPVGFNPEPQSVRAGRRFLYDAVNFSAHGTVSCASCHPNGHRDGLAWDLGDPTGSLLTLAVNGGTFTHHPMKGPMMVQSLRGLSNATPLHWRSDRRDLTEFNQAFPGLLGSKRQLTTQEMSDFVAFVNTLSYPPNPNENLDRTNPNPDSGPNAFLGAARFRSATNSPTGTPMPFIFLGNANNCNACHLADPGSINNFGIGSFLGTFPGSILSEPQQFKVPQLRGIYQKAGMQKPAAGQPRAEQITGFGFMHDGAFDTIVNFLKQPDFKGFTSDGERRDIEAFLMAKDSVLAPAVGLQVAVNAGNKNSPEVLARVQLLVQQAQPFFAPFNRFPFPPNCDLVVRGIYGGRPRSFLQTGNGFFQPDSASEAPVSVQQLLDSVGPGTELTFTGVPTDEGRLFSIDRDGDGVLDDDAPHASVQIAGRVVGADGSGVAGVTVTLSGTQAALAVTDAAGRYTFNFLSTAGTHTVTPQGAGLQFTPAAATFVKPASNRTATFVTSTTANAADSSQFFVAQHYADFLGREPDASGLQFWTNEIEKCGADQQCREVKRVNVSAAFFLSIEFQETGYLVYRAREAAFGDLANKPVPVTFQQLMTDAQRLGRNVVVGQGAWQQQLETNKQAFFTGFVQRPEFLARYPAGMDAGQFVDALNANAGGSLNASERDVLAGQLAANNTTSGRAAAVRAVAENAAFKQRETNRAFVLMQYFGYLRRDPDSAPEATLDFKGYQFWLSKLDSFGGNFVQAEMVRAFINSTEYRSRFGQP